MSYEEDFLSVDVTEEAGARGVVGHTSGIFSTSM